MRVIDWFWLVVGVEFVFGIASALFLGELG